jgi:TolB-like protein
LNFFEKPLDKVLLLSNIIDSNKIGGYFMKNILFCIFTLFTCAGLFAQQPVVAVAPFDAISGISSTDANMITRVFFIRLGNTNKVSLVDRNVVDRVLREHSFQTGDWSNQQKTAELGKALNSDWIVRGELESFGTNILVTVQFYDIQTFRFMGGADLLLSNVAEAMEKMDPLVNKLVETIASSESQPRQQGGNTDISAYYGTWVARNPGTYTLIADANRITIRHSYGGYIVLSNCTWTAENNTDINTLTENPRGFKVFGTVTDHGGGWSANNSYRPIYLFIHRSDSNRMFVYASPDSNSEIQDKNPWPSSPYGKIQ